jgi:Gnt-I system high-affinity gluconate transporter
LWFYKYLGVILQPRALAILIATVKIPNFLGSRGKGQKDGEVMESAASSIAGITMVLLIIAGAGALKKDQ